MQYITLQATLACRVFLLWENTMADTITARLDALEKRLIKVEKQLNINKTSFNNSTVTLWREKPERETVESKPFSNYVNHYIFLTRSITSEEINNLTKVASILGFLGGTIVSLWFEWSWLFPPTIGVFAGIFVWSGLMINRNGLLNKSMESKTNKNKKPLTLEIKEKIDTHQIIIKRLELKNTITKKQLSTYAQKILSGDSMTFHNWTGDGGLFSQGQYQNLGSKLEQGGYANKGVGNKPRTLTKKGIALFKVMAKL